MSGKIFISYRRGDDPGYAGRLFDSLQVAFGPDRIFMDVDGIEAGMDFLQVLEQEVAQSEILLAVIGSRWIDALDSKGNRRLENPRDFVRVEIEAAMNQNKWVIPVLVGNAEMPTAEQLPESLQLLARRQSVRIKHEQFRSSTNELIERLRKILDRPRPKPEPNPATAITQIKPEEIKPAAEAAPKPEPEIVGDGERSGPPPAPRRELGLLKFMFVLLIGVVVPLGVGVTVLWYPSIILKLADKLTPSILKTSKDTGTGPRPSTTDRVNQTSPSQQVVPIAPKAAPAPQRVVLYDEDPADPKGQEYVGTVVWRTEQINASRDTPADHSERADIDIPQRKLKMILSFRRNSDPTLPASHTVEITFVLPKDFAGGGIANVPGILMKSDEQARGTPLVGLSVPVTDAFFMVGLSNVQAERTSNIQLLKDRMWFDVPLVYANKRRAIMAIEKGPSGERAFADAFAVWDQFPVAMGPAASAPVATAPAALASSGPAAPALPSAAPIAAGPLPPGGFIVQVSSQKSEADAQASYRALQIKFPTVLGPRTSFIKKADLGDKGVFYRAVIGPFDTADAAAQFCGTLKAAGGQCVVQKN